MAKKAKKKTKSTGSGGRKLVIVESPTKAKTIRKFLPKDFIVEACIGHIRDLPASAKEIPAKYKKEKWASLGINVDKNFEPLYVVPSKKLKVVKELRDQLARADELILATDEDREGESISFHLVEVLKPDVPVKRMVFHEITRPAIAEALEAFRDIDQKLVEAQETRRILDRLVGYSLSPLIWKKIAYGLSAGRVQSVAVRFIAEREKARLRFKKGVYCGLVAELEKNSSSFEARLVRVKDKRVATGKDFDEQTGQIAEGKSVVLLQKEDAEAIQKRLEKEDWTVDELQEKPLTRKPSPPFITSSLQQEANRKLGLSAREAMRTAQSLYEKGLITYMRTDSVNLSQEAIQSARRQVEALYGKEYLSPEPRQFKGKAKGAQEAHEAIRPSADFLLPDETKLKGTEKSLYELIWKRTMATQMAESKQLSVSVTFRLADEFEFQASGTKIVFPGFIRAYVEGRDDVDAALEERESTLPDLKLKEKLKAKSLEVTEHETKPPARFTEASLVQTLEKEGVGRPSTYASIISTIMDRGYVRKAGNSLIPTFTGFAVNKLLEKHFPELVDSQFTASMEESLDAIAEGQEKPLKFLSDFFLDSKKGLRKQIAEQEKKIDPEEARSLKLEKFPKVDFRIGRFGPYFSFFDSETGEELRASIPEEIAPADLDQEMLDDLIQQKRDGPPSLGEDPDSGEKVYLMTGRYGAYLQLGIPEDPEQKPKRAMIPKTVDPKALALNEALGYLRLPRDLGKDPEGHQIKAGLGRFGPFVVKTGKDLEKPEYRSLKKEDSVLEVDLERAIALFKEPKGRGRRRSSPIKSLGEHPQVKKPIEVYEGPYGPYVKCGKWNASIPKEISPSEIPLEKAVELIDARRA
ncbi:MAG: type I DNA topoisomerase [Bradymonadales bacterium]|nr:MAG: type I DNA topoisomerase [Bradymonadales bacterium]